MVSLEVMNLAFNEIEVTEKLELFLINLNLKTINIKQGGQNETMNYHYLFYYKRIRLNKD